MDIKKIVIADDVKTMLAQEQSFLGRQDIRLFNAATTDNVLAVHRAEKVHLIIIQLDMPGMKCEELCSRIRDDRELRAVSLLILCPDNPEARERGTRCNANAIMTSPVTASSLLEKAQHLLNISWRESYRVLLSVRIEGTEKGMSFFCRSENISTSGMLLETDKVLAKGDRVACSFFLPDSKQIKTSGEIVRVIKRTPGTAGNNYGVKFDSISPDAKAAIETFVERKSQVSTSRK